MKCFPAGTPLFDLLDYLREEALLGPGNLTQSSLHALIGDCRLDTPYHFRDSDPLKVLQDVAQYLPLHMCVHEGQLIIAPRKGLPC